MVTCDAMQWNKSIKRQAAIISVIINVMGMTKIGEMSKCQNNNIVKISMTTREALVQENDDKISIEIPPNTPTIKIHGIHVGMSPICAHLSRPFQTFPLQSLNSISIPSLQGTWGRYCSAGFCETSEEKANKTKRKKRRTQS